MKQFSQVLKHQLKDIFFSDLSGASVLPIYFERMLCNIKTFLYYEQANLFCLPLA